MIKKQITFKDLDGNDITDTFYFNLSKAELADMEFGTEGGLSALLQSISATNDPTRIYPMFKEILGKSYGQRFADNRRLIKSPEITKEFFETDAFDVLLMELLTDATDAAVFIKGIMPKDLEEQAAKVQAGTNITFPNNPVVDTSTPVLVKDPTEMTREELLAKFQEMKDS